MNKFLNKNMYLLLTTSFILLSTMQVFAEGTPTYTGFDKLFEMFSGILQKVGGGVGLIGAVQFGLGMKNDNPDGKVNGVKTMATGTFLFAVATGYKVFLV